MYKLPELKKIGIMRQNIESWNIFIIFGNIISFDIEIKYYLKVVFHLI